MSKHYFNALENPAIDAENGIIRSASLMASGDAKGHFDSKGRQVIVDDTTLEQIFKQCKKLGTIKVKADHGSGVFEIVGWADNFSLTADKVLADIHLYESEPNRPRLLEIAEKNPSHMGISMEFTGEDKPRGTVCMARCDQVIAAALVDDPAANKSLFAAVPDDESEQIPTPNTNTMDEEQTDEPTIKDLMAKFEELSTRLTTLESPADDDKTDLDDTPDDVATDKKDEPEGSDPDKTYSEEDEKKIELAANRIAEAAVKKFAATMGITKLGKSGAPAITPPAKDKSVDEHVAEIATKEFGGDKVKAFGAILSNKEKYATAYKAWSANRQVQS